MQLREGRKGETKGKELNPPSSPPAPLPLFLQLYIYNNVSRASFSGFRISGLEGKRKGKRVGKGEGGGIECENGVGGGWMDRFENGMREGEEGKAKAKG